MAGIGRGRSLKNLRIRGKSAAAFTPHRPAPATPGTCLPLALDRRGESGRWPEPGLPPLAWERILIGAVCLFRAGRNDSGEENVPLDLTRGNAGRRGRRRRCSTGEESGARGRGQGRARHGTRGGAGSRARAPPAGPREPSPGQSRRTHPPSRCPLSSPRALLRASGCCGCRGGPSGTRRSLRPTGFSRPQRQRGPPIPELEQPNPGGGQREVETVI